MGGKKKKKKRRNFRTGNNTFNVLNNHKKKEKTENNFQFKHAKHTLKIVLGNLYIVPRSQYELMSKKEVFHHSGRPTEKIIMMAVNMT